MTTENVTDIEREIDPDQKGPQSIEVVCDPNGQLVEFHREVSAEPKTA